MLSYHDEGDPLHWSGMSLCPLSYRLPLETLECHLARVGRRSLVCISVACFSVYFSEALTEQLMSLWKGTGSDLLSYWRKSKSHFWSSWKIENYACICYAVLNQALGKAMVTHAVHERLNAVLLIGWIVLLCKNCYYTVCETNHAAGEKLNRLTERSLVNSNTRCIAVIRDSGGHSPFYGRSAAGMKYFSGKWHPSGKSPRRLILCCLHMKERREWGGGTGRQSHYFFQIM